MNLLPINDSKPLSRKEIAEYRAAIAAKIENGDVSPLKIMAMLKFYNYLFDGDDKKNNGLSHLIKQSALTELSQYGKSADYYGLKFEECEAGQRYDYSHDPVWNNINGQIEALKAQLKSREELLKNVPMPDPFKNITPMTELDPETGEAFELRRPLKTSTTTIKMSFPRY